MNPNPPPTTNTGRQPTPTQVQPITTAELQAWIARREKFRGRVKAVFVLFLVVAIGGVATFWTLFHEQLIAIGALKSNNFIVSWDIDLHNFLSGGETEVSLQRGGWASQNFIVKADQLHSLTKLLHLKSLDFGGATGLHDQDVGVLSKLKELKVLQLYRTRDYFGKKAEGAFSDEVLEYVKDLTKLKSLVLTDNNITDAGVAKLANLTELETLDLEGTQITDKSLEVFKKMKSLRFVNVVNTGVTRAAANLFRAQNTKIEITSEEIPTGPDTP